MQLKQAIEEISGFRFMTESLNIQSSAGRRHLASLPFLSRKEEIAARLEEVEAACIVIGAAKNKQPLSMLSVKLMQLRDIVGTIKHLANKETLNDVELFEIKHFALLSESIKEFVAQFELRFIQIPQLVEVIDILDPEKKRIPHFYIYNQYSTALASLRAQINRMSNQDGYDEKEIDAVRYQAQRLENEIRRDISQKLLPHANALKQALNQIARLDVLLAKAFQAQEMQLCKPGMGDEKTSFSGLFHPEVQASLRNRRKDFQPVDIDIPQQPTVITGANMAGKSVLLKSVALAQTLAQFGFYVPAKSAEIVPVEQIVICMGDEQNELSGLSSFAAEMLRLNAMAESVMQGKKLLVLIDELARTTNPTEGKAIVCGMIDFLMQHGVRSLITTHYGIGLSCRKLRVKGFVESKTDEKITIGNINNHIDYSLEETTEKDVPHEAIRIAEIIGVDERLLTKVKQFMTV